MITPVATSAAVAVLLLAVTLAVFVRWGSRWGSTPDERALELPGDRYLDGGPAVRAVMTRAISIAARPETVWPWLTQLGRGAGWYSIDWLDNGRTESARHIVSWIPEPCLGDASPIGYLRFVESGRELIWWVKGLRWMGASARLVVDIHLATEGAGSRLGIRVSADAGGPVARPAMLVFRFVDSIMARRQLLGIRERVERYGARADDPDRPETGATEQYQLYEVIYASGERAGVAGKEGASRWRATAIEDGILTEEAR